MLRFMAPPLGRPGTAACPGAGACRTLLGRLDNPQWVFLLSRPGGVVAEDYGCLVQGPCASPLALQTETERERLFQQSPDMANQ